MFRKASSANSCAAGEKAAPWLLRYKLDFLEAETVEPYLTKQMARDRFFTVRAWPGVVFCELREPGGRLWFRDHYFEKDSPDDSAKI